VQDGPRSGQPKESKYNQTWYTQIEDKCETSGRRIEYEKLFEGKDPNSGLTIGFSTMTMPLGMMR
jgi:hypothetical protein